MLRRIPIVAHPISWEDLISGLEKISPDVLSRSLSGFIGVPYVYLTDSGTSALYLILKAISGQDQRKEVIIPAYTASSIVYAIEKAGLIPILCDIRKDDFNLDTSLAAKLINKQTLAVIGVHMFGLVNSGLPELKKNFPGIYVLEDCCQGFGSKLRNKNVGNLADASFFSFNRGKNLPVFGGGALAINNIKLAGAMEKVLSGQTTPTITEKIATALKLCLFSIIVRPYVYGLASMFLTGLREKHPAKDFPVKKMIAFQSGVAGSLLRKIDEQNLKRYQNAVAMINALKNDAGIITPNIDPATQPAFNRLPILIDDLERKNRIQALLKKQGIDSSSMYYQPLHKLHQLSAPDRDLPNAIYLAGHLLTVPCHPFVDPEDVLKIIEAVKKA